MDSLFLVLRPSQQASIPVGLVLLKADVAEGHAGYDALTNDKEDPRVEDRWNQKLILVGAHRFMTVFLRELNRTYQAQIVHS